MKRISLVILCILPATLFNACKHGDKKPAITKIAVVKPKDTVAVTSSTANINATDTTTDECLRAVSEPVVKKSVFPDATFRLEPDHRTGIETLTLPNGDKVTIKQSGCEYFTLTFKFETSRFAADTTNMAYWSNATLQLLRQVVKGIDTPLEMENALAKLSARIENAKTVKEDQLSLNEDIDFGGPDPRQYLTIERVGQLAEQRYVIEVSVSYGPM